MSDSNEHEPLIKTPKQLICAIAAAFVIPIAVIVLLAKYVTTSEKPAAGSNAMTEESIAERLKPVAQFEFTDANAPRVLKTGIDVYNAACAACHTSGAAGAPKFADKDQWAPRLSKGFDTLWKHAVQGFNTMPAKGGNSDLDDIEVARAVAYMANQAGADFKEPEPAAPAQSNDKADEAAAVEATATTKPEAETPAK